MEELRTQRGSREVASLVLGILSFVLTGIGIICGIIAIVFGRQTINGVRDGIFPQEALGKAQAGFILGIIGGSLNALIVTPLAIASIT